MSSAPLDRRVADLARRQHGVFSRTQAFDVGLTKKQVDYRFRTGQWLAMSPGVYALPGNPAPWQRKVMAAILGEPSAVAARGTAAVLHSFEGFRPGHPEISVPLDANHRSSLAVVRRSGRVASTVVDHIPVTTVEQTVVDLAANLGITRLDELVGSLTTARVTTIPKVSARLQSLQRGNLPGSARLTTVLVDRSDEAWVPPASVLEAALYGILGDPRLPEFVRQPSFPWTTDDPRRLDALIERWRLILEADGRTWHTRRLDFARDRRRDHEALVHGYLVLRLGWEELMEDPGYALDTVLAVGAQRETACMALGI